MAHRILLASSGDPRQSEEYTTGEPRPITSLGVHDAVLRLLEKENVGKVLDAGAGEGALTKRLTQLGFDVEACDINPDRFKLKDKVCRKIDLNEDLPYPNELFNFVVCVETIEHLLDPWCTISEFSRVLRKNGKFIITTPNILSILSRLMFMAYGEYHHFSYLGHEQLWREKVSACGMPDMHMTPLSFWQLRYLLLRNNMRLEGIDTNRYSCMRLSPRSELISTLLYPLIKFFMKEHAGEESLLASDTLLCGEILILKARKL